MTAAVGQNQTTKLIFLNFDKFRVEYGTIIIAPNIALYLPLYMPLNTALKYLPEHPP